MTEQDKAGLFNYSTKAVEEPQEEAPQKAPRKRKGVAEMAQKKPITDHMSVGSDILSEEDHEALRAEARNYVLEDQKKVARKRVLQQMIAEERRKYLPEEELLPIVIDLPGHAANITLDGQQFLHNTQYVVPVSKFRALNEIMYRAWQHEDVVGNVNRDRYFRPNNRDFMLRPGMESLQHPNSTIMRV